MSATILIVEDNPDNMKLLAWALEDEGYEVEGVGSAEDALTLLDRKTYDLVLMDISLPGMDGKEATRQLRGDARFATLPIIAVTAHAVRGERESILAAGASELITKPVDEELLLRTIKSFTRPEVVPD